MRKPPPRALVVEDHPETQFLLELMLEGSFELTILSSARDTLRLAEHETFDVCLIDISLGTSMNGVALMKRLRRLPGYTHTPMVAMTAYYRENGSELLDEGFDSFVQKPFDPPDVLTLLEELSRARSPQRDRQRADKDRA